MTGLAAFHLAGRGGRLLCILSGTAAPDARGAVVYVHPFAEEMNKSRRAVALQARALAAAGWAVLQIDLAGCGDSDGDFADATWDAWVDNVEDGAAWMRERTGRVPVLWGLRVGALVASAAAARMRDTPDLLMWQPVIQGRTALAQFLRVDLARQLVGGGDTTRASVRELREAAERDGAIEVAGYTVSRALARALDDAELAGVPPPARSTWIEVTAAPDAQPSPAAQACVTKWREQGMRVELRAVHGPWFWQTQEIAEAPAALLQATLAAIEELRR